MLTRISLRWQIADRPIVPLMAVHLVRWATITWTPRKWRMASTQSLGWSGIAQEMQWAWGAGISTFRTEALQPALTIHADADSAIDPLDECLLKEVRQPPGHALPALRPNTISPGSQQAPERSPAARPPEVGCVMTCTMSGAPKNGSIMAGRKGPAIWLRNGQRWAGLRPR
jgi:hypothetical protein